MKKFLSPDEYYPYYEYSDKRGSNRDVEIKVSARFIKKCDRIMREFEALQEELNALHAKYKPISQHRLEKKVYVSGRATGKNNGASWLDAYTDIGEASKGEKDTEEKIVYLIDHKNIKPLRSIFPK